MDWAVAGFDVNTLINNSNFHHQLCALPFVPDTGCETVPFLRAEITGCDELDGVLAGRPTIGAGHRCGLYPQCLFFRLGITSLSPELKRRVSLISNRICYLISQLLPGASAARELFALVIVICTGCTTRSIDNA
jgi:hypothetical protein